MLILTLLLALPVPSIPAEDAAGAPRAVIGAPADLSEDNDSAADAEPVHEDAAAHLQRLKAEGTARTDGDGVATDNAPPAGKVAGRMSPTATGLTAGTGAGLVVGAGTGVGAGIAASLAIGAVAGAGASLLFPLTILVGSPVDPISLFMGGAAAAVQATVVPLALGGGVLGGGVGALVGAASGAAIGAATE